MRAVGVFLAALALAPPAYAGAWLLPEGQGEIIFSSSVLEARSVFDAHGHSLPTERFTRTESSALVQYGLTDWLTAIVKPEFKAVRFDGETADSSGLGTSEAGLRVRLLQTQAFVLSAQATVGYDGARDPAMPLSAAGKRAGIDARLLAGVPFALGSWTGFVEAQAGIRTRGAASEWRGDATLGVRPWPSLLMMAQLFNAVSQHADAGVAPFWYSKLQASVVYDLTAKWSLQAGVFMTVAGHNVPRERGALIAVWRRF